MLQSAMKLATFLCPKDILQGLPRTLQYVRNTKASILVSKNDEFKSVARGDGSEVGSNGATESVEERTGSDVEVFPKLPVVHSRLKHRFWCSMDFVVSWRVVPGVIIYSALIALVVISVVIGLKNQDKGWDTLEVSLNQILTGAVAIVIGVLSFDINGRKILFD